MKIDVGYGSYGLLAIYSIAIAGGIIWDGVVADRHTAELEQQHARDLETIRELTDGQLDRDHEIHALLYTIQIEVNRRGPETLDDERDNMWYNAKDKVLNIGPGEWKVGGNGCCAYSFQLADYESPAYHGDILGPLNIVGPFVADSWTIYH